MLEIVTDRSQSVTHKISLIPILTGRSQIPAVSALYLAEISNLDFKTIVTSLLPSLRTLASTPSFTSNPQTSFCLIYFSSPQFLMESEAGI